MFDFQAVHEDEISVYFGDIVQVITTNQQNMCMVFKAANSNSPAAEGWIPAHVIGPKDDGSLRKSSWQLFKQRMQGLRPERKTSDPSHPVDRKGRSLFPDTAIGGERKCKTLPRVNESRERKMSPQDLLYEMSPSVLQPLTNVAVQAGETAILTCRICGRPRPNISWRFNDNIPLGHSPRVNFSYNDEGYAVLQIFNVNITDGGEYYCIATSNLGSVLTRTNLTVLDRPGAPGRPLIKNQVGTSVHLEWSPPSVSHSGQIQGYTIEMREVCSDIWQAAIPYVPNTSQVIGDLTPGLTYQFRVSSNNSVGMSDASIESDYIMIPSEYELNEQEDSSYTMWKSTFENDFTEIEEVGRGRFAVVKKCLQKCSNQEVIAKCFSRRQFRKEAVELEFNTLQSLQHENLIRVYDLYENASNLIILMEIIPLGRLFDFLCSRSIFDELEAADYVGQLLTVVQYLHNCRIAHLDVKPENLLVQSQMGRIILKLIDFGDARHIYNNYYIHTMVGSPEFLAPEIIQGTPVGLLTDIWSIGVLLYILLSGVSPFLDESKEETCSNIINNDFCFPEEYFQEITTEAKDLIKSMLIDDMSKRPTAQTCLESLWIHKSSIPRSSSLRPKPLPTSRLSDFIERKKHQGDACMMPTVT